jgi:hypothetical protein
MKKTASMRNTERCMQEKRCEEKGKKLGKENVIVRIVKCSEMT